MPEGCAGVPVGENDFAIIDQEDLPILSRHKWHIMRSGKIKYARTTMGHKEIVMHRIIMGGPKPGQFKYVIDHIDGNGLNNTKSNLRWVPESHNRQNIHNRSRATTSLFQGVSRATRSAIPRWEASIKKNNRKIYLGTFTEERTAALAYDTAARKLFGASALQNFPGTEVTPSEIAAWSASPEPGDAK